MSASYHVVEIFPTLQGEGFHAGTPSVFARFSGCNLWSGHEQTRDRDADRHGAKCPVFCDTDFRRGTKMPLQAVVDQILQYAEHDLAGTRRVTFTGGEPLLQLDVELLRALVELEFFIAIETNGTLRLHERLQYIDWVCVSPKVAPEKIEVRIGDELKVVYPDYDPRAYQDLAARFDHAYISPAAAPTVVGKSVLAYDTINKAAKLCMELPGWKLSLQTHKVIGLP